MRRWWSSRSGRWPTWQSVAAELTGAARRCDAAACLLGRRFVSYRADVTTGEPSAISLLLHESRRSLERVEPADLEQVRAEGALVVDVRPVEQRTRDGELPGAIVVGRNVLEWRLDPTSPDRLPVADDPERRIVVVCNEGYSSSLAAHTLQRLGLVNATDLVGGYQAWLGAVDS